MTVPRGSAPAHEQAVGAILSVLADAGRPERPRRCGVEVELIVYSGRPPARARYWGEQGVRALLERLAALEGEVVDRDGEVIKKVQVPEGLVSLEHGGQVEFSSRPHDDLWELADEWERFLARLDAAREELDNVRFICLGFDPLTTDEGVERPGDAMTVPYLRRQSEASVLMALHTAAVHVSLDFRDSDLDQLFAAAVAVAPFLGGLFANSPFCNGRRTEAESVRGTIWLEVEAARSHPSIVYRAASAENVSVAFAEHVATMPLIYWKEDDEFVPAEGRTLTEIAHESGGGVSQEEARLAMKQCWTHVRLKDVLELRGMDTVAPNLVMAAAAMACGLMYDEASRRDAALLCTADSPEVYTSRWASAAQDGCRASAGGWSGEIDSVVSRLVALARDGLERRGARDSTGRSEAAFLEPLGEWLARHRAGRGAAVQANLVERHSF